MVAEEEIVPLRSFWGTASAMFTLPDLSGVDGINAGSITAQPKLYLLPAASRRNSGDSTLSILHALAKWGEQWP